MSEITVFWHEDALLHDTGEGRVRASAVAPDRGARAASRERRADPQHPLGAQARPDRAPAPLARRPPRHGRGAGAAARSGLRRARCGSSARRAAASLAWSTVVVPGSWPAALAAAGTALAACQAVIDGECPISYALVRPARPPRAAGDDRRLLPVLQHRTGGRAGRPPRLSSELPSSTGTSTTETARRSASTGAPTCSRSRSTCRTAPGPTPTRRPARRSRPAWATGRAST